MARRGWCCSSTLASYGKGRLIAQNQEHSLERDGTPLPGRYFAREGPTVVMFDGLAVVVAVFGPDGGFVADHEDALSACAATLTPGSASALIDGFMVRALPSAGARAGSLRCLVVERIRAEFAAAELAERHKLTAREREILQLVFAGAATAEISESLSIARSTAEDHVKNIRKKLGVRSRAQIVAKMLGLGSARTDRSKPTEV